MAKSPSSINKELLMQYMENMPTHAISVGLRMFKLVGIKQLIRASNVPLEDFLRSLPASFALSPLFPEYLHEQVTKIASQNKSHRYVDHTFHYLSRDKHIKDLFCNLYDAVLLMQDIAEGKNSISQYLPYLQELSCGVLSYMPIWLIRYEDEYRKLVFDLVESATQIYSCGDNNENNVQQDVVVTFIHCMCVFRYLIFGDLPDVVNYYYSQYQSSQKFGRKPRDLNEKFSLLISQLSL